MDLVLPADEVRASSGTRRLFTLAIAIRVKPSLPVRRTVNPPGTTVNPSLALFFFCSGSISSRRTRVGPAWGMNRQETRLYAIALETGAEGKTDLVEMIRGWAWPPRIGEMFLTIISLQNQTRLGAWNRIFSGRFPYGLCDSYGDLI